MELTFLSSMTRDQLKEFFASIMREVIGEGQKAKGWKGAVEDPDNEPMVPIREAAKITGLAVNTLYEKTHLKLIPHYKKGKRLYFRPSQLLAWIGQGRVMTQDEIEAKAITHVMNNPTSPYGGRKSGNCKR
jgi:excisionase family DNA binding protein